MHFKKTQKPVSLFGFRFPRGLHSQQRATISCASDKYLDVNLQIKVKINQGRTCAV